MDTVISCHFDTVFKEPYGKIKGGVLEGACDNIAAILSAAQLIGDLDLEIQFTEEEELHMDGARYLAKRHNPQQDFIIVLEGTDKKRAWKRIHFTVENWHGIAEKHIKKALKKFTGRYKMIKDGGESEAWLYREMGYACVEVAVPVAGGLHNLEGKAEITDILQVARAVRAIADYVKVRSRDELSDIYKVGDEHNEPNGNSQEVNSSD